MEEIIGLAIFFIFLDWLGLFDKGSLSRSGNKKYRHWPGRVQNGQGW